MIRKELLDKLEAEIAALKLEAENARARLVANVAAQVAEIIDQGIREAMDIEEKRRKAENARQLQMHIW